MSSLSRIRSWVVALGLVGCISTFVLADVPRLIQYQGKLLLNSGAAVPGPINLRIRLYDQPAGPTNELFDETHPVVQLANGLFSVLLGSATPGGIPDSALAASEVYIGVTVDGGTEFSPRRRIATTPYTVKAKSAEQLVKPNTVDPGVTLDAAGRVGIGTASPHSSASVDIASATGGFLPPRMTTVQRDAIGSPADGLMIFNTTTGCPNMWMNGVWRVFGAPDTPGAVTGPNDVCAGSTGVAYSVGDVLGAASFQWDVPPGSTVASGQGTAFIAVSFGPLSGTVAVKAVNACGTSASNTLPMVVSGSPPATPAAITGGESRRIAGDTNAVFSVPAVFGATGYSWTVPSEWTITNGQGSNSITATVGPSDGDVSVTADNACGSSLPQTQAVLVFGSGTPIGYIGMIEQIVVPAGVTSMTIEAWGAEGGAGGAGLGGKGARIRGTFAVTPDEVLKVLVGQKPPSEAGGGGGTFVTREDNTPLIIAGGGAGNGDSPGPNMDGTTSQNGQTGGSSGGGGYPAGGTGGTNGNGGGAGHAAAGGGGLLTDGVTTNGYAGGGKSFLNGGAGGTSGGGSATGGFGGGGGGYSTSYGGGGGGYSGGGGGGYPPPIGGGGAGSFNAGSNQDNAGGIREGDGQVVFSW